MKQHKLLLLLLLMSIGCGERVDLLVHNAQVYTVNDNFDKVSAFAVKNGKFVAVGGEELLEKYKPANTVDAQGLSIYPGFIDAHSHLLELGLNQFKADLKNSLGMNHVVQKLKEHQQIHNHNFIMGIGWDQNQWKDNSYPDNKALNIAFPNTPVVLIRVDGHAYLVNNKAIEMAMINENTKIEGGQIIREKGKLTGLFIDNAMDLINGIIPEFSREQKVNAYQAAQELCFENGLTTVTEAGLSKENIYLLDSLQKSDLLKIRVYAMIENDRKSIDHFMDSGIHKTAQLNVRSVKIYADGALGSRGAALKSDYSDQKGHRGSLLLSKDSLKQIASLLAKNSFQLNTHAIGDAANQMVLEAYNGVLDSIEDPRWRIEHAQVMSPEDFQMFNDKIIPSVQPLHATSDMNWAVKRIGIKRLKGAYAYKDLLDWSGLLALGTDFPVEEINPFQTFYAAVSRKPPGAWSSQAPFQEKNALSRYEALLGITKWAAYASFEENEKGSIEVGKYADFVILDQDIMRVAIDRVIDTKIVATILNGKIVFSNRL
ncbi:MAG: amidohydrolase [Flavobacteriaceae bacterium]|jgi:predicted amidohydrolase YtcJ|nr:amidohydrolase [Flavobacteriaceae bacterium]